MDEKELETDADVVTTDAATTDVKEVVMDEHASVKLADLDPIDYLSLLMEQEHR